jgi:hypothetical protein
VRFYSPKYSSRRRECPKDAGKFAYHLCPNQPLTFCISIVEFASSEDAQRAIRELSEVAMLGRPVFIREVRLSYLFGVIPTLQIRTGKTNHASAPPQFQARLEWQWRDKA